MNKSNVINLFNEVKKRRTKAGYEHMYEHFNRIIARYEYLHRQTKSKAVSNG